MLYLLLCTALIPWLLFTLFYSKTLYYFLRADIIFKKFPQQTGLPILRNLFDYRSLKQIIPNSFKAMKNHGGVVGISVFIGCINLQMTDMKFLEYLLGTTNILNKGVLYTYLQNWLGTGLLTANREKWKKTRKILTPAFHFQILEHYVHAFHSSSEILINKLREKCGEGFDVAPYITLCTLDMICEAAMGTKVNAQINENSRYVQAVKDMCRIVMDRYFNPLKFFDGIFMMTKDYKIEKRALEILHGYTYSVISQRRAEKTDKEELGIGEKKRLAFLDLMLQAQIDGRPMTDQEIREEVDTFMFEGHDTTASGISFILYCLSLHQDIQAKVLKEILNIFGGDNNRAATLQDLQNMTYFDMVIKECLRLYPPVPVFMRCPETDVKFFGGTFPKSGQLAVFAYGVHRDPENYPDPEKFDPERFTPENQAKRNPYSYLTFSAGPRNCIGQKFAMLEMKATVSHILRNFQILPVDGFKPELIPLTVLKSANGVYITLKEIN